MSAAIIDASVGVKWFVPEIHAAEARCWCNGPDERHVPAFFFDLEIAHCLHLAVAVPLGGRMVTADQRLHNSLGGTPWASYVGWVGDMSAGP